MAIEILGRKRRIRRQATLNNYKDGTLAKIEDLKQRINQTTDPDVIKRLKNQISAFESRLLKRASIEKLNARLESKQKEVNKEKAQNKRLMETVERILAE